MQIFLVHYLFVHEARVAKVHDCMGIEARGLAASKMEAPGHGLSSKSKAFRALRPIP